MNDKMKMIAFIILIIVIIIFGYFIYSNATKNDSQLLKDKVVTEVKYIEVKLVNIANRMNNITTQNFKVTSKEVEEESGIEAISSSSSESDQGSQSQGNGESNSSSENSGSNKENSSLKDSSGSGQKIEEFNMEQIKELQTSDEKEINWDDISKEIEEIYTVMPTITLDLYQTSVNQEDILSSNAILDELAIASKNKEEENTLNKVCDMYSCISKFIENTTSDEVYKTTIKTKESVLKGYTSVTLEKWDEAVKNVQNGIDIFSVLLTNTNIASEKQVNINKIYVIINELKNASDKQDKDIFFIKYKNLLEEMNSM